MIYCRRTAKLSDYPHIMALIADGKKQMDKAGITQWDTSYPNKKIIRQDIQQKHLLIYGMHYEASVAFSKNKKTGFIQRLVVSSQHQRSGIARFILSDIIHEEKQKSELLQLKISTNHSNLPMQHLLSSLNFISYRTYTMPGREHFGSFIEFIYPI
ncbi:GNAT family N-acetyltransferase [Enterococcus pseudoavium]|uniref:GNAT family N-acetyltransferase n=1 Tax=Enterococcus pseudoavium TaxID=44007 RepID=A0AAE4KVR6_9ENTE|nr:GNAT family N-acetyltransferase [Enterococcus pseudoavium]MDT2735860.1 GNAT family N-acetyltransferase [Enterococcus pseudoavium]MDT2754412.1 GNAT family N-acetyltransferase [Enterococcus pseudoavium]MDT2769532.1 GNAT family N-acetyltransferase [Enterococcus pseudoavium]